MANVLIIDAATGERIEREQTPNEIKQRETDAKAWAEREKREAAEEKRQAEARAAAIVHAKSLGFTDEMIMVMYPLLAEHLK